jgi:hypothetical protein
MNTRRRQWLLITVLAAAMALTACADNNETPQPANGNEAAQNNGAANDTATDNGGDTDSTPDMIQGTGQYVGQIDTHSIEINGPEGPAAYQLADGMEAVLETLNEGDEISFEYYEQAVEGDDTVKQLILTTLSKSGSEGGGVSGNPAEGSILDGLPATKTIDVEVEGMVDPREAKLVKGEGYGFYMFEQFSFDAAANKLTMNIDPDYSVEFIKLPSDYNLDALREEGEQELKPVGEIRELKDEELHKSMQGASLFLIASGDGLTKEYIVKEIDGTGYVFKVNMPQREASEGFGPLAFASINSLVSE